MNLLDREPHYHHRRSIRLRHYDYTQEGAYSVTICAANRRCIFGDVTDDEIHLSRLGHLVHACWVEIPAHYPHVQLDSFVIMPNHLHGILVFSDNKKDTMYRVPTREPSDLHENTEEFGKPISGSLSTVIRTFKAGVTRRANRLLQPDPPIWQSRFYESIIRSDEHLYRIREYIARNPAEWESDRDNPLHLE